MANPLLTIQHLTVGYPNNILFERVTQTLHAGELVCLMGPNAVGKSTLIRTIAGIHESLAGEIYIHANGKVSKPSGELLSVVLTEKITAVHMSALELVFYGRYPYLPWHLKYSSRDNEIVSDSFEKIGIAHLKNKKLYELSDGQLQLVMLARALAQETPVIILDEATAHLDLNNRVLIMNTLSRLAKETSRSILIATHELDLALQMADKIWLADNNKSIRCGIPEDLVLSGYFDEVFQFKGFDLMTGRVHHTVKKDQALRLVGEGYAYLWSKNALERTGYAIGDEIHLPAVYCEQRADGTLEWNFEGISHESLESLLNRLHQNYP